MKATVASWLGAQRIDLESCGSTNDEAARLARAGARHGTIVIAELQSAGRGRNGHTWTSPADGLFLSAVLRPPLPLADVPPMTLAIGIGLCDAVREAGAPAHLKWPNDLLVGRRKLAGVLVEAQSQGNRLEAVIVGIGVNLAGALPAELGAVALADATGATVDREAFIASLLAHVELWIDRYIAAGLEPIVAAWEHRMARQLAARATIDGAAVLGELVGLDRDGALLLCAGDGTLHRIRAGDVEMLGGGTGRGEGDGECPGESRREAARVLDQ